MMLFHELSSLESTNDNIIAQHITCCYVCLSNNELVRTCVNPFQSLNKSLKMLSPSLRSENRIAPCSLLAGDGYFACNFLSVILRSKCAICIVTNPPRHIHEVLVIVLTCGRLLTRQIKQTYLSDSIHGHHKHHRQVRPSFISLQGYRTIRVGSP